MRTDDAFVFGFREGVHDTTVARGPVGLCDAVNEDDVDVVDAEFSAETVEVAGDLGCVAVVGLGHDYNLVARELLQCGGDVGMAAVGVGSVEEAKAILVEAVDEQAGERTHAEAGLVRGSGEAYGAGAHGKAAGSNAGLAEGDLVVRVEFLRRGFEGEDGGKGGRGG